MGRTIAGTARFVSAWTVTLVVGLAWILFEAAAPAWGLQGESASGSGASQPSSGEDDVPGERPQTSSGVVFRIPIRGTIDLGLPPFVARVVESAAATDHAVVLLDIDTFGGRVDGAVLIRDTLIDAPVKTVAFIHPRAISAGALISLACEVIVMAPGGSIGAATPITGAGAGQEPQAADEKVLSYMRTEMRTTAEKRGRRGDVAEAMVDADVEIEGVVEKGKVLTLTTDEALALKIADHKARNLEDALEVIGLSGARVEETETNWAEAIARAVSEPTLSSLLLSIGFLGIMIELYQPGWGLPGTVGILSLATFFFGHHVARLAGWEELMLFALGAVLLLVELLVIPGFGVIGASGVALMLVSILLSLLALDLRVSWDLGFVNRALVVLSTSLVITAVLGFLVVRLLPGTRVARRFVLGESLAARAGFSSHDEAEKEGFPLGTLGEAITDLRPAGKIKVASKRIDAVSEGDYIASGERVKIVQWRSGTAVVRAEPGNRA
ncbi:MAG TPA: NfeD family protein [Vicinamibacteria bacterium]|nr:NfeD family protein [Vicinamibacteria bacterium]